MTSNLHFLNYYNNDSLFDTLENNYENSKHFKSLYFNNYQNVSINTLDFNIPVSYTAVLDSFRADFDENSWLNNTEQSLFSYGNIINTKFTNLNNSIKLRSTAKNAIVTYNANQKVYKSRFDDSRSNMNFKDITNSFVSYPFITETKAPYEKLLGKNKESFFNVTSYSKEFTGNYQLLLNIWNSLNVVHTDIPFLLSLKSDASRYLWFDWQARWSSIEVQPSSIAKYSLAGLPYFTKTFEYATQMGDELNESENYLTKISRARKNYMPNWSYSPYFFSKVTNWFRDLDELYFGYDLDIKGIKVLYKFTSAYWKLYALENSTRYLTTPSFSASNVANKTTW
jgi:hypothetical protein